MRRATNGIVTRGTAPDTAANGGLEAGSFTRDWQSIRADEDIQFAVLQPPKAPEPPGWLEAFFRWLGEVLEPLGRALAALGQMIGLSGAVLGWILGSFVAVIIVLLLWRMLGGVQFGTRAERPDPGEAPGWTPGAAAARALLADADRLAAEGRYDEATHLLLQRSVEQIESARPGLLEPSSTAREIALLPALPAPARAAFDVIAQRVERSLFALRSLSADDWHAARAAYADFALLAEVRS